MAKQQYYVQPWRKNMEAYQNFSGGLNTVTSNENLSPKELRDLTNIDLGERGSLRRRNGFSRHYTSAYGKGQGYFRYYKSDGTFDEVVAVNGALEVNGASVTISGLTSFQTTRQVEAVQFKDKLYIATGTKLVQWDGTSASVVTSYEPKPLEMLYIGGNGLASDPDAHMQDGTSTVLRIDAVTFSKRYAIVNGKVTLTAYSSYPSGSTVEYKWEQRRTTDEEGFWETVQNWSTSKTYDFNPEWEGDFQFRVKARLTTDLANEVPYYIPKYKVKPVTDPKDDPPSTSNIHTCNRIVLHWNRLILYGDTTQGDVIYISHLNNPTYFPIPNSLRFENGKKEGLTKLVQYRDMIVAFTNTTIQALYGKSPLDFKRISLNTDMGCIAPESAKVLENYIVFLSHEGVHFLKSVGYTENKANVEKIDTNIENIVDREELACGVIFDNQYHILFPGSNKRLRYYYEYGTWTKDESDTLDFDRFYVFDGKLYGQSSVNGNVLVYDETVFTDDGFIYFDKIETKHLDFNQPYNPKKLKELQVMFAPLDNTIRAKITVLADSTKIVSPSSESHASVDANGNVIWNVVNEPNLEAESGTSLGSWEMGVSPFGEVHHTVEKLRLSGKCLRVKLIIEHEEANTNKLMGIGFIYKVKKP